jgi:hypothetical protein
MLSWLGATQWHCRSQDHVRISTWLAPLNLYVLWGQWGKRWHLARMAHLIKKISRLLDRKTWIELGFEGEGGCELDNLSWSTVAEK